MNETYDLVIVGGGIAGSGLATLMAGAGKSVLLLEKTTVYKDIVRGEWLAPWGVVEAKRTGLYDVLTQANDHHITYHVEYGDGIDPAEAEAAKLDLTAFVPGAPGPLSVGHPQACQALNDAAVAAGATVIRGIGEVAARGGASPEVTYVHDGVSHTARARLVIGADGRGSVVRRQAGVTLHEDAPHHLFAGLLVDGADGWPEDLQSIGTEGDVQFFMFPQGGGRVRLYISYGLDQKSRFAGDGNEKRLLEAFRLSTVPYSDIIVGARAAGPCHSAANQSTWTDTPAVPGILLVGDAAGFNDPITGQGLSISLRDVRIVSDLLLGSDDWTPELFAPYAEERAERMRRLRFSAGVSAVFGAEFGREATARKLRYRQAIAANPTFALCRAATMVGPDVLPPQAFSAEEWDRIMAV